MKQVIRDNIGLADELLINTFHNNFGKVRMTDLVVALREIRDLGLVDCVEIVGALCETGFYSKLMKDGLAYLVPS